MTDYIVRIHSRSSVSDCGPVPSQEFAVAAAWEASHKVGCTYVEAIRRVNGKEDVLVVFEEFNYMIDRLFREALRGVEEALVAIEDVCSALEAEGYPKSLAHYRDMLQTLYDLRMEFDIDVNNFADAFPEDGFVKGARRELPAAASGV